MRNSFARWSILCTLGLVTLTSAFSQIALNPRFDLATRTTPLGVAIGDLDGDGRPDIVVCNNENGSGTTISVYRNLQASPGLSGASFDQRRDFAVGQAPWDVVLADVNGDGKLDIVVSNQYSAWQYGSVSVLRNVSIPGDIQLAQNIEFGAGTNAGFIAVADIDGDGKSDIAVTNINSNSVSILRNHCIGVEIVASSFVRELDVPTGRNPVFVALADLDGDGLLDLLVTPQTDGKMTAFRNMTSGNQIAFGSQADYPTGNTPQSIAVADFDGDGKPDVAVGNSYSSNVAMFRNLSSVGNIVLGDRVDLSVPGVGQIRAKDLDGDGKLDLITANPSQYPYQTKASVLRNVSTVGSITPASFEAGQTFTVGVDPWSLAVSDLDGDGRPDVVVSNAMENTISILRNTSGMGTASGLVAYYPFNGDASDASGNGNNGTVIDATPTTDRFGIVNRTYGFNGSSSYISILNSPSLQIDGDITVCAWVKTSNAQSKGVIEKYYNGILYHGWLIETGATGGAYMEGRDGRVTAYTQHSGPSAPFADNQWHFLLGLRTGNLWKIFLDGQLSSSADVGGTAGSIESGGNITIGAFSNTTPVNGVWQGSIDDIRIYNRALSDSEIDQLYHEGGWPMIKTPAAFYLHGSGSTVNPTLLSFDASASSATTPKYKDSPGIKFSGGNLWQQVGKWDASVGALVGDLASLGSLRVWIGLKNSDDIGTNFDLRAELWKNNVLVTAGEAYGITGITRNLDLAKEVMVSFPSFARVTITSTDVASLRILTRIGTNGAGGFLGGHSNAVGLRVYFDALSRCSKFDAELWTNQSLAAEHPAVLACNDEQASKLLATDGEFTALQNYPNPFNPSTTIVYRVAQRSSVRVAIYNSLGQLVRELVNQDQNAGLYTLRWEGTNEYGRTVSTGMYFCKFTSGVSVLTRRMLMVK
jgi:hypothetical protein